MKALLSFVVKRMKIIAIIFGALGIISANVMFAYENRFITYPSAPDPATLRVVPYLVKQRLVRYVTKNEYLVATASHYVFYPSWVLVFLLWVLYSRERARQKEESQQL